MMEQYERDFVPDIVCRVADAALALVIFDQPPQIIRSTLRLETPGQTYFLNIDPSAWDWPDGSEDDQTPWFYRSASRR